MRLIGNDDPVLRGLCPQGEGTFEARLLKAREDSMAVVRLELRVKILLAVLAVDKRVQPASVLAVLVQNDNR